VIDWWLVDVTDMVQGFVSGTYTPTTDSRFTWTFRTTIPFYLMSRETTTAAKPVLIVEYEPLALESTTFGAIKTMFR